MDFNRCFGCMEEYSGKGRCPHCGYDARLAAANADPSALPEGTILAGRYVSGKVFGSDPVGNTCIGWDLNMERKVAIREYYPKKLAFRKKENGKDLVFPGEGSEEAFQEGMQKYIRDARTFTRFLRHPRIGGTQDVFLENNTSYVIMEYLEQPRTGMEENAGATMRMIRTDEPLETMMKEKASVKPVGDLLLAKLGKKDMSVDAMSQLAGLSRAGGYKLVRNQGNTTQDTLLRVAFVLEFSAEETQELLKSGHCAPLTAGRKRDRAIIFGLKNHLTLGEMDEMLEDYGLPLLVPRGK